MGKSWKKRQQVSIQMTLPLLQVLQKSLPIPLSPYDTK